MEEKATGIVLMTAIFVMVALFVINYFIYFKRKKETMTEEHLKIKEEFQTQLLQSRIEVQEETFQQIGKELHDNVGQLLSTSRMLIGLTVIWLLIIGTQSDTASFRPVTALWVIAVPLMDMVAIMIRRIRKGQSPFMADREHLHHIFLRLGLNSRQALVLITSLASMLATIGIVGEYLMVPDLVMLVLFLLIFSLYSLSLQYIWRITRFIKRYKAKQRAKNNP